MRISEQLNPNRVLLHSRADKVPLLGQMVHCLVRDRQLSDEAGLLKGILRREEQVSTGLGGGLAVPHTRSQQVGEPVAVLAVLREGMDFDALDGQAVRVVLLFVSPEQDSGMHAEFLAAVARLFDGEEVIDRLCAEAARSSAAVYDALHRLEQDGKAPTCI